MRMKMWMTAIAMIRVEVPNIVNPLPRYRRHHHRPSYTIIELKAYDTLEEFKQVTMDVLKKHPLAEYIAERVYSSEKPNIRDCVGLASMCQTEQDVLRMLRGIEVMTSSGTS